MSDHEENGEAVELLRKPLYQHLYSNPNMYFNYDDERDKILSEHPKDQNKAIINTFEKLKSLIKKEHATYLENEIEEHEIEPLDYDYNNLYIETSNDLFVDEKFKNDDSSIFGQNYVNKDLLSNLYDVRNKIKWERVKHFENIELFKTPSNDEKIDENNFKNYFCLNHFNRGILEKSTLFDALNEIMNHFALFQRIVPFDNIKQPSKGLFHFRFWVDGCWKDVVIDDFLPIYSKNKLIFVSTKTGNNTIWLALLEKALAKVLGSYSCLSKLKIIDMLLYLSGGLLETYDLYSVKPYHLNTAIEKPNDSNKREKPDEYKTLWNILIVSYLKDSTVFCLNKDPRNKSSSLCMFYAIKSVHEVIDEDKTNQKYVCLKKLVRTYTETDAFKEKVEEARKSLGKLCEEELELLKYEENDTWLFFSDFVIFFSKCKIFNYILGNINTLPQQLLQTNKDHEWVSYWDYDLNKGNWVSGLSAGGRIKEKENKNYYTNPRFLLPVEISQNKHYLISLIQKYKRSDWNCKNEKINISLFKITCEDAPTKRSDWIYELEANELQLVTQNVLSDPNVKFAYTNSKEVTHNYELEPGKYVIIPSTYEKDTELDFHLRIFFEQDSLSLISDN